MKKVSLILVCLLVLASASLAAVKAPVAKAMTSSSSGMRMGAGTYAGWPVLLFNGDTSDGAIGGIFSSTGGTTTFGILGKYTMNISGGNVPIHMGGELNYVSTGATNAFTVRLLYGAQTIIAQNFIVSADLFPLTYISGGAGTFTIGGGAVSAGFLF